MSLIRLLLFIFFSFITLSLILTINLDSKTRTAEFISNVSPKIFVARLYRKKNYILGIITPLNWTFLNDVEKGLVYLFGYSNGSGSCPENFEPITILEPVENPIYKKMCWPTTFAGLLSMFNEDIFEDVKLDTCNNEKKFSILDALNQLIDYGYISVKNYVKPKSLKSEYVWAPTSSILGSFILQDNLQDNFQD